jgi:tRNA-splicing ligase RtcB
MNRRQLEKLGVPSDCIKSAIAVIQTAVAAGLRGPALKQSIQQVVAAPQEFAEHEIFAPLAQVILADDPVEVSEPISYKTWGAEGIDEGSHRQMEQACSVPSARAAALMPDAHIGYGLPIGGVLACENAVIPYAVGVDIACRMKLSILDIEPELMVKKFDRFRDSLQQGTVFGVGKGHKRKQEHDVMDQDWTVSRITRERKDKAWNQLGSSGSGNHFAEFGEFTLAEDDAELGLQAGTYVALMSHSGSRGVGAAVCSTYSAIAQNKLSSRFKHLGRLAWLEMDSQEGQEYWAAMNLMGDYAAANHVVIHRNVTKLLGAKVLSGVENHHNFAWKEVHDGRELIVHRKGATPAGEGVLGVIPGSMADPAFVVRGKGNAASLCSASHGAGRLMSRTKAKAKFTWNAVKNDLAKRGIRVLSAGADEVPGVYKNIEEVMAQQRDLVETVARFDPKIVKMCDDGSRPED